MSVSSVFSWRVFSSLKASATTRARHIRYWRFSTLPRSCQSPTRRRWRRYVACLCLRRCLYVAFLSQHCLLRPTATAPPQPLHCNRFTATVPPQPLPLHSNVRWWRTSECSRRASARSSRATTVSCSAQTAATTARAPRVRWASQRHRTARTCRRRPGRKSHRWVRCCADEAEARTMRAAHLRPWSGRR